MKDYYKILGVLKTASTDEIKKAYRKLAREYHPDKTGGDEKKNRVFLDVNEAYEVLGNEDKRKNYDEKKPDNTSNNKTQKQSESGFTPYSATFAEIKSSNACDVLLFSIIFSIIFLIEFTSSSRRPDLGLFGLYFKISK